MATQTTLLTYEAWLRLPETRQRYDILDGEICYMSPAPTPRHQRIAARLFRMLEDFVERQQLGEVFFAPLDVVVRQSPLRTRQPDLLFISTARQHIIGPQYINGGPDLVVEILSPANMATVIEDKLADYRALPVYECWLVDPRPQTIEVRQRTPHGFVPVGSYGVGEAVVSPTLPGVQVPVAALFA